MIGSPHSKLAKAAVARSQSIDQQLDEAREMRQREVQLLILGSASSGKSTFNKQLRIVHGDGFPLEERARFAPSIYDNVCEALTTVINNMDKYGIILEDDEMKKVARELFQSLLCPLPASAYNARTTSCSVSMCLVMQLWRFSAVQDCYKLRDEYDLSLSESHFLDNLGRISSPGYIPSLQDILYIRKPTVGVQEQVFSYEQLTFRVIDVAGQKSHRKKWIHLFDCVTAVIFFSSLSSFCEKMEEDPETNALQDSLQLFQDTINNKFLSRTDFILFLNKRDLLEKKLKKHSLTHCCPHYTGDNSVEDCIEFISKEFTKCKPESRRLHTHISCATDMVTMKPLISKVMAAVVEINLRRLKVF